jgi:hypothetical protein
MMLMTVHITHYTGEEEREVGPRGGGGRYRYKDHATTATSAGRHDLIQLYKGKRTGRGQCMNV